MVNVAHPAGCDHAAPSLPIPVQREIILYLQSSLNYIQMPKNKHSGCRNTKIPLNSYRISNRKGCNLQKGTHGVGILKFPKHHWAVSFSTKWTVRLILDVTAESPQRKKIWITTRSWTQTSIRLWNDYIFKIGLYVQNWFICSELGKKNFD